MPARGRRKARPSWRTAVLKSGGRPARLLFPQPSPCHPRSATILSSIDSRLRRRPSQGLRLLFPRLHACPRPLPFNDPQLSLASPEVSRPAPPTFRGQKAWRRRPLGGIYPPPEGARAVGPLAKKIALMTEPHH